MKRSLLAILPCLLVAAALLVHASTGAAQDAASSRRNSNPPNDGAAPQDSVVLPNAIVVENWTKPESGWLYILDARPDSGETGGRIWLVDPVTGKMMGSIRTSYHPDFALSPDGSRLYIASDTRMHVTEIAVVDTASGTVLGGQELSNRVVPPVMPAYSTMAVSESGATLWVLTKPTESSHLVAIDTITGAVLPGRPDLGHCEDGQFISLRRADQVQFICPTYKKIHLIPVDDQANALDNPLVEFPWNHKLGIAEAFPSPGDEHSITIVRGDGAVYRFDTIDLGFRATAERGGSDHVLPAAWPTSPDGSKIYLGYSRPTETNLSNEFRVFDTSSWKKEATIKTTVPFWSAAVSRDGKRLYALAPQQHALLVIDTATMHQISAFTVGSMPALAIVAP
jgi:DNA-binding beta-propeller fold protein YncE